VNGTAQDASDPRPRLGAATGAALLAAGVILVAFVLPAEFAVDPLGTGARVGLLQLGEVGKQVEQLENAAANGTEGEATLLVAQPRGFTHETVTFELGPREGMEYKYRLDKGKALLFSWKASVPSADSSVS